MSSSGDGNRDELAETIRTASLYLSMEYGRAMAACDGNEETVWVFLRDATRWARLAAKVAGIQLILQSEDDELQADKAAADERDLGCPACKFRLFRLVYMPERRAAGMPPYRVECARCLAAAGITETNPGGGLDDDQRNR